MNAPNESAKQRLRQVATRGHVETPRPDLAAAKAKLRSTATSFDQTKGELACQLGVAEVGTWVKNAPWRASLAAAASGFIAGNIKESEVLLLDFLLKLLDSSASKAGGGSEE